MTGELVPGQRLPTETLLAAHHGVSRATIREALRLLEQRDKLQAMKLEELRKEIRISLDQADRGELLDGPEVFEKLRTKVRTRRGSGRSE